jgi:ribulose 1,5-bisphosphate synthetase/thiazole synthase
MYDFIYTDKLNNSFSHHIIKQCRNTIIGGGLAGLYVAYKLNKMEPNAKLLILERNRAKKHFPSAKIVIVIDGAY